MTFAFNSALASAATADGSIVGDSAAIREVRYLVGQVAASSASVIVTGPSGSGKEVVARAIHATSERAARSFVAVNCGAIPRDLLESELFGHEKGSFTGAVTQKRGRFEDAHGGTLFLDEIGDMPADMQVKLLRVLEERAIQRVGGRGEIAVDTRIVSATHRDIDAAIEQQRFREDLFYRLSVFPIHLPSLAERREDVPLLIAHFLRTLADRGKKVQFTKAAMDRLAAHSWPGNVRELRNIVERAIIMFGGQTVSEQQAALLLSPRGGALRAPAVEPVAASAVEMAAPAPKPACLEGPVDLRSIMSDLEHAYISEALRLTDGVVAEAARLLSLQRTTLIEKMRKYSLPRLAA